MPVVLAERGRDQVGNQEVQVGALVARGIDSMLVFSWLGTLVSLLLLSADRVALHVTLLLAAETSTLLSQTRDIFTAEPRDAVSIFVAGIRRRLLGVESGDAQLHGLQLGAMTTPAPHGIAALDLPPLPRPERGD